MSENKKQSLQYTRTHNDIIRAFIKLLNKQSFEKITVQDILDATPVTRATFYRHFRDKYDIAERLFESFKEIDNELRSSLAANSKDSYADIFNQVLNENIDMVKALLIIHTDQVDLRAYLEEKYIKLYQADAASKYSQIEASIYASIMTSLQLAFIEYPYLEFPSDFVDMVITPAFLQAVNLNDDQKTKDFLQKRFSERSREPLS